MAKLLLKMSPPISETQKQKLQREWLPTSKKENHTYHLEEQKKENGRHPGDETTTQTHRRKSKNSSRI